MRRAQPLANATVREPPLKKARRERVPEPEPEPEDPEELEEGEEDEEDDDDEALLQEQLKSVPFCKLLEAQRDGAVRRAPPRPPPAAPRYTAPAPEAAPAPRGKNRPAEQSSRRPVPRGSHTVPLAPLRTVRDPRFEAPAAAEDAERERGAFRRRYAFLYDERLPAEKRVLKARAARERRPEEKAQLRAAIGVADEALRREAALRKEEAAAKRRRLAEREAVAAGKKPFYVKKADAKRTELVERYEELKAAGRLEGFLEKRRRKLAAKDRTLLR
jgi:ribosomal RNA-processing protein 36